MSSITREREIILYCYGKKELYFHAWTFFVENRKSRECDSDNSFFRNHTANIRHFRVLRECKLNRYRRIIIIEVEMLGLLYIPFRVPIIPLFGKIRQRTVNVNYPYECIDFPILSTHRQAPWITNRGSFSILRRCSAIIVRLTVYFALATREQLIILRTIFWCPIDVKI